MVKEIRTITASVGASASVKVTTSFEKDLNVVGVIVTERSGTALTNVHLTFDIDGVPLIRPSIPAAQLGINRNQAMDLKFTIKQGSSFGVSITNNLTSAITLDIALLVE
jgi:hypothetical protein